MPWANPLEPAFRALSWLWAYDLVRAAGCLRDDDHVLWLAGFHDHGRFLRRHLEFFVSPYNHLLGEATALFLLGVAFPEFCEAEAWRQEGRRVLETTVGTQFHRDGGTVEQSTFYHHASLGFYLLASVIGRVSDRPLSSACEDAIERGLEFSMALAMPDGRVPRIGGADDGKPIRFEHARLWDFRPYLAIGAVLFDRGDFKQAAGGWWEDAWWLLGRDGLTRFDALASLEPAHAVALPETGYVLARSDGTETADYLCFDCGPQAAGLSRANVPSAAHGHADCLSVVAALGGRPVLVDPGFFCYNGEPVWEVDFRRTAAHNTLVVDGQDQARHRGKMAWTHTYRATLHGAASDDRGTRACASHDGYRRLGVRHRRTVWLRAPGYLVLLDEIVGRGSHDVAAGFQFSPGVLQLDAVEAMAVLDGRFALRWIGTAPIAAETVSGGPTPLDGWVAPSLGVRRPAPRLRLTFETPPGGGAALLSVLGDREVVRVEVGRSPAASALEARVAGPGWLDVVQVARPADVEPWTRDGGPVRITRTAAPAPSTHARARDEELRT